MDTAFFTKPLTREACPRLRQFPSSRANLALYGALLYCRLGYGYRNSNCQHDGIPFRPWPYASFPPLVSANPCALSCTISGSPISLFRPDIHRLSGIGFAVPGNLWSGGHVSKGAPLCTHHLRRQPSPGGKVPLSSVKSSHSPVHRRNISFDGMVNPNSWIASPVALIPVGDKTTAGTQNVYIGIHTSTGHSPLHSVVNH